MSNKYTFYTCPYCKEEYSEPVDLAHCILRCEEKKKREEEEVKRAKLKAEKDARYKEIVDAYENFEELRDKYVDDYGSFTFKTGNGAGSVWRWVFDEE